MVLIEVDFRNTWSDPANLTDPSAKEHTNSPFLGKRTSFALSLPACISDMYSSSSTTTTCSFLHPMYCPLCNTICLRPKRRRSTIIPRLILSSFAEFRWIISLNNSWAGVRFEKCLKTLFRFLWSFRFARISLWPLSGQILHDHCEPVTDARLTFFVESFVVRLYQSTKLFGEWDWITGALSAENPCNCWSFCTRRNFGPSGSMWTHNVSRIPLVVEVLGYSASEGRLLVELKLADHQLFSEFLQFRKVVQRAAPCVVVRFFCLNGLLRVSSSWSTIPSRCSFYWSLRRSVSRWVLWCRRSRWRCHTATRGSARETWDNYGHAVLALRGTFLRSFKVVFDHKSTHRNIRDPRRAVQVRTGGVSWRSCTVTNRSKSLTDTVASSFVCTSPWAVMTSVELLHFSYSFQLCCIQVPLARHVHGGTGIHDELFSCGLMDDGAGRHHTSDGKKNVALFASRSPSSLYNCFAKSQASLRAHRSFANASWVRSSNFGTRKLRHEGKWVESPQVMVFFPVSWRTVELETWNVHLVLVSMNWCPSANSVWISAAPHLEIHIPIASQSEQLRHFLFRLPCFLRLSVRFTA